MSGKLPGTDICPHRGADLDGGPIPEESREHFSPPYRFSRRIGLYDLDRDRTTGYACPDCGGTWSRETVGGDTQ